MTHNETRTIITRHIAHRRIRLTAKNEWKSTELSDFTRRIRFAERSTPRLRHITASKVAFAKHEQKLNVTSRREHGVPSSGKGNESIPSRPSIGDITTDHDGRHALTAQRDKRLPNGFFVIGRAASALAAANARQTQIGNDTEGQRRLCQI